MLNNFTAVSAGYLLPLISVLGLIGIVVFTKQKRDFPAFLSSTAFIAGSLGATAFALFPNVLPASTDPKLSLTIYNTAAHSYGLGVGLTWWIIGAVLTGGYFIFVYRLFRGKTSLTSEGY
jgi:cytochrome d ubiquinol oxidase subunit II